MEQTVYRLGAGDEVRISVFGLDALTNTYVVGDAGTISLPLVDEIPARGKTTQELEALIANNLRQRDVIKDPSVDRKRVGEGKSVSVSVAFGGRRDIKKKKTEN